MLLGTALCVFSSNNGFVIENILHTDGAYSWRELIDKESGKLAPYIKATIEQNGGSAIAESFEEIVKMRNRIIHGFRCTSSDNEQALATKEREHDGGGQFLITEEYLRSFIEKNNELSELLHAYRGY